MWHAYNLIREGDAVTATTFRKIQKDSGGTAAVASERVKIKLTIKVEEVDFDAEGMPLWQVRLTVTNHCSLGLLLPFTTHMLQIFNSVVTLAAISYG